MARSAFYPSTVVPGATRKYVPTTKVGVPAPAFDSKGRPVWDMPQPSSYAIHFKNAAMRRNFLEARARIYNEIVTGGITREEGVALFNEAKNRSTVQVPIYRGTSALMANRMRGLARKQRMQDLAYREHLAKLTAQNITSQETTDAV